MAMRTQDVILGVVVSKDWIDAHVWGDSGVERVHNEPKALGCWLRGFSEAVVAIEATNTYHETLVDLCLAQGLTVYLIDGFQLKKYAEALRQRMRNDPIDAELLARFLAKEIHDLCPYRPKSKAERALWRLLKYRAQVVKNRGRVHESARQVPGLARSIRALRAAHDRHLAVIERQLRARIKALAWDRDVLRLQQIPGVGEITAIAVVIAYRSGSFSHHDSLVAYFGLDVRTKDSGKHVGQRKLSKKGDPEFRRLLHCAAMNSRHQAYFKAYFARHVARGMSHTAALVALARKLVRVAFSMLKYEANFDPNRLTGACRQP